MSSQCGAGNAHAHATFWGELALKDAHNQLMSDTSLKTGEKALTLADLPIALPKHTAKLMRKEDRGVLKFISIDK